MKNRRGAALAGAIILCSLIITVSLAISAVFINMSANNIVRRIENQSALEFDAAFNKFVSTGGSKPEDTSRYTFEVYEKDEYVKALVGKIGTESFAFYGIYDFQSGEGHSKVLAYQTSHLDIEVGESGLTLGGLGPFTIVTGE